MGAPDFVLKLREKIGNDPLWLPAVRGVVFDDEGRSCWASVPTTVTGP